MIMYDDLGCTCRHWAVLGCYVFLLGCTGLYKAVLGCTGLLWPVVGCTRVTKKAGSGEGASSIEKDLIDSEDS